jgi:hypothetical protein
MNIFRHTFAAAVALALLPRSACATAAEPPAPVLEWSFYVLLIFAALVVAFVFLKTSKRTAVEHAPRSASPGQFCES